MKTSELDFDLPQQLIAQKPLDQRSDSRLLVLAHNHAQVEHRRFSEIVDYLNPEDCLVLNETKVIPARFHLQRATGGRIEGLFLNLAEQGLWHVLLKNASRLKTNETLSLHDPGQVESNKCYALTIHKRLPEGHWHLHPDFAESHLTVLERCGAIPLPPYIHRPLDQTTNQQDRQRYQTVYAKLAGSVAAPTAGLHFTPELLDAISQKGIHLARLTLHVGLGTFKPVTTENLEDHVIHEETYSLDPQAAETINHALEQQQRVVAVGTTSVRTLETLAKNGRVQPGSGSTRLFITPGYPFQIVSAIITNFHLPRSSLLALVGAFAGTQNILDAYQHAIEKNYRFFSYGDAMLLL